MHVFHFFREVFVDLRQGCSLVEACCVVGVFGFRFLAQCGQNGDVKDQVGLGFASILMMLGLVSVSCPEFYVA